jgi:hypothetical protein
MVKTMKRIISYIFAGAAFLTLFSCNKEVQRVEAITVSPDTYTLTEGETLQLSATVSPANAPLAKLFWHSQDDAVATVTADGLVTAVKEGENPIKIIASGGMRAGYCLLTVKAPIVDVTGVSINPKEYSIYVGETLQLEPTVEPANASNKKVTYKSDNEAVATVVKTSGLVTGVAPGTATITITTEDQKKTVNATITVAKGPVGLDSNGSANSYIVTEAGEYFFTPTKGNSSDSPGAIASVEVLWETVNTDTAPSVGAVVSEVKFDKGKIWFRSNAKGNAVIAAKDASGTILWSWHVWNTLEEVGTVTLSTNAVVLDRNVGALTTTGDLSAGLMFQWGRKDPFLGAIKPSSGGNVLMKATADLNNGTPIASTAEVGTMEYSIQHPTVYIQSVAASAWDWFYKNLNDTAWGGGTTKTIYDPCPAGYSVPPTTIWTGLASIDWPLSGRLGGSGKSWNAGPGGGTSYWASNCAGGGAANGPWLNCTPTSCNIASGSRALGCPIRCTKEPAKP